MKQETDMIMVTRAKGNFFIGEVNLLDLILIAKNYVLFIFNIRCYNKQVIKGMRERRNDLQ